MPTDFPAHITNIGFEYDPVVYAPLFWGNPLSLLNALAAFDSVHGYYLTPNSNSDADMAYGYTDDELALQLDETLHPENFRHDSNGNTYVMIPAKSLPLVNEFMGLIPAPLKPVAKPFADLVSPVLKVLIDLGYDWSGDPGIKRTLIPLPFNPIQNWPAVGVQLVAATIQGIQAFLGDIGGLAPTLAPTTTAPVTNTPVSTLAAAARTTATDTTQEVSESKKSTANLTVVKDSDSTVQQTAAENETTPSSTEEPAVTKPESTTDEKKADETHSDKKADETKADDKKADEAKADATKADATKADATKSDNDKKSDTDKKDADTAKAAA
jgi:hypothetical protein